MELKMASDQFGRCYEIISQKNYEIGFRDGQSMIQGAGAAVHRNPVITNMIGIRAELFDELLIGGMTNSIDHDYFKISASKSLLHHRLQPKLFTSAKVMDGSYYGCSKDRHSQSIRNFSKPRAADSPLTLSSSSA